MDKPIRGITTRLTWPLTLALDEFNTKPNTGGGLRPPYGFVFLSDADGALLTDPDGVYYLEAA